MEPACRAINRASCRGTAFAGKLIVQWTKGHSSARLAGPVGVRSGRLSRASRAPAAWPPGRRRRRRAPGRPRLSCGAKPSARARTGANAAGQVPTMAAMSGSAAAAHQGGGAGLHRVQRRQHLRHGGADAGRVDAAVEAQAGACPSPRRAAASRRRGAGWRSRRRTASGTGSSADRPSSGSRMIEERNELAALFGRPGRTMMVGRRIDTASRKPRRDASARISSAAAFCAP